MALSTWWKGDPIPVLSSLPGMAVSVCDDAHLLSEINGIVRDEVRARIDAGHRAYVASLEGVPVAYGWVATVGASIGELDLRFALPDQDRYLWDFATLPAYRGRGIYPRLLQAILSLEASDGAERFWIIHAPENFASGAGIAKAGLKAVSELSFHREQGVGTVAIDLQDRASVGAAVLGVTLVEAVQSGRVLSPCWRCVLAARSGLADHVPCWERDGGAHTCACALPQTNHGIAANDMSSPHPAGDHAACVHAHS